MFKVIKLHLSKNSELNLFTIYFIKLILFTLLMFLNEMILKI